MRSVTSAIKGAAPNKPAKAFRSERVPQCGEGGNRDSAPNNRKRYSKKGVVSQMMSGGYSTAAGFLQTRYPGIIGSVFFAPHADRIQGMLIMPNFINLPAFTEDGDVHVVVETPRGSRAKFAYDPKLETFALTKSLLTGLTYPHDWGFVPSTKADDGDPLDIMVIHDAATFPGLVITCRVIGILQIEQKSKSKSERNDRLFAVPRRSHSEQALEDVRDLTRPIQEELEKFFIATDELEDKKLKIIGWKGPKVAVQAIKDGREILRKRRRVTRTAMAFEIKQPSCAVFRSMLHRSASFSSRPRKKARTAASSGLRLLDGAAQFALGLRLELKHKLPSM